MTDVNDRTRERYEPEWQGEGPQDEPRHPRNFRRWLALAVTARVLGAGALLWGLLALWGPAAAAIAGGLLLLRASRLGGRRHHGHHVGAGPRPGRPRFHFGCGGFSHAPFRQPMV